MSSPPTNPVLEITAVAGEGGRAAAVAGPLETALIRALAAARPGNLSTLSALNLEVTTALATGAPLRVRAWVERATRTLAFVSGEVFDADGARAASGAGVFELQAAASEIETPTGAD